MNLDKHAEDIDKRYENGELTNEEYHEEMRSLRAEAREMAEDAAERAYNDSMDRW